MGGYPQIINFSGIFPNKNHPAIGVPAAIGKPPAMGRISLPASDLNHPDRSWCTNKMGDIYHARWCPQSSLRSVGEDNNKTMVTIW